MLGYGWVAQLRVRGCAGRTLDYAEAQQGGRLVRMPRGGGALHTGRAGGVGEVPVAGRQASCAALHYTAATYAGRLREGQPSAHSPRWRAAAGGLAAARRRARPYRPPS